VLIVIHYRLMQFFVGLISIHNATLLTLTKRLCDAYKMEPQTDIRARITQLNHMLNNNNSSSSSSSRPMGQQTAVRQTSNKIPPAVMPKRTRPSGAVNSADLVHVEYKTYRRLPVPSSPVQPPPAKPRIKPTLMDFNTVTVQQQQDNDSEPEKLYDDAAALQLSADGDIYDDVLARRL
jgi:hypothetical protein